VINLKTAKALAASPEIQAQATKNSLSHRCDLLVFFRHPHEAILPQAFRAGAVPDSLRGFSCLSSVGIFCRLPGCGAGQAERVCSAGGLPEPWPRASVSLHHGQIRSRASSAGETAFTLGRQRFRSIQACRKDLPAALWQAEVPASGLSVVTPDGEGHHVRHKTAPIHHAARRRGGCVAARGASAAAGGEDAAHRCAHAGVR
jgi:hypothetical protein